MRVCRAPFSLYGSLCKMLLRFVAPPSPLVRMGGKTGNHLGDAAGADEEVVNETMEA